MKQILNLDVSYWMLLIIVITIFSYEIQLGRTNWSYAMTFLIGLMTAGVIFAQ